MLGSPLTTVTMDRGDIAAAYPELIRAAEGPVLDTSCACLLRLAAAVHEQGYKVVAHRRGGRRGAGRLRLVQGPEDPQRARRGGSGHPRCRSCAG